MIYLDTFIDKSKVALNAHLHVCGKTLQLRKMGLSEQQILTYIKKSYTQITTAQYM